MVCDTSECKVQDCEFSMRNLLGEAIINPDAKPKMIDVVIEPWALLLYYSPGDEFWADWYRQKQMPNKSTGLGQQATIEPKHVASGCLVGADD